MTNKNNLQVPIPINASGGSVTAKVRDFVRMNPPIILGFHIGEDLQNIRNKVKKLFGLMKVTPNDKVELASYHIWDVAHVCFT